MTARLVSVWNRFWFAEVDGLGLALVRSGFGVTALSQWLVMIPKLRLYYGDEFPIATARSWGSEWMTRFLMPSAFGGADFAVGMGLLYGVFLVALIVGWRTRLAAIGAAGLTMWFQYRNPSFLNAGDAVLRLTGLYLAIAFLAVPSSERALSIDRVQELRAGRALGTAAGPTLIPAWTLRTLQIQVCLIYLVSGFWKVSDPAWRNGTALWIAMANPFFSRLGPPSWAPHPLFAVGTLVVALWEFLFPGLVAWRMSRMFALGFGLAMHLFILVFLNTGVFPLAMLSLYPAFLGGSVLNPLRRSPHPGG